MKIRNWTKIFSELWRIGNDLNAVVMDATSSYYFWQMWSGNKNLFVCTFAGHPPPPRPWWSIYKTHMWEEALEQELSLCYNLQVKVGKWAWKRFTCFKVKIVKPSSHLVENFCLSKMSLTEGLRLVRSLNKYIV